MESPATKRMRLSASRTSISGRKSLTGAGGTASSLARTATGSAVPAPNRLTSQPSYDFIIGESNENEQPSAHPRSTSRPPSRQGSVPPPFKRTTLRQSMLPKPESQLNASVNHGMSAQHQEELLALRAKINTLEYELKNLHSEQGLVKLQHEKELHEVQARANTDHQKYQAAETERLRATRAAESAAKEMSELRDRAVNEKTALERKAREAQSRYEEASEEKEDVEARFSDLQRDYERFRVEEVEGKRSRLERTLEEVKADLDAYRNRCDSTQKRLEEREGDVERLEKRVMELGDSAGGSEELQVIKRELSEQVAYVRRLEGQVREQNSELRKLRDERRSVNVVEEEKRSLETQLQVLREAEQRLGELEIQKEILEDEKRMWTSLLERESGDNETFESPEAVVRALVNERIEHALAVDRLGGVESEMVGKDEVIRALETERNTLREEVEKSSKAESIAQVEVPDNKAYKRLDRQRQLAVKEVEYLRAQLKTFDAEETVMMDNASFDNQRAEQIKHLESLVDQYKSEIQTLHTDLSKLETDPPQPLEPRGTKRAAEEPASAEGGADNKSDQIGPLLRKNKNLQTALQNSTKTNQLLATELQASKSQLKALRAAKSTRVLELRDNPTAQAEAIKLSTLRTLKAENQDLMLQLRSGGGKEKDNHQTTAPVKSIPVSALDAVTLDLQALERQLADKEKRMKRQREIWTEKAAEFRDIISSILGYRVTFMPNGKVKVSSIYYRPRRRRNRRLQSHPDTTGLNEPELDDEDEDGEDGDEDEEEEEDPNDPTNYILFDGEKGTMKISGGTTNKFRKQVETHVDYWVKEKKEIPLFLAAMNMDFFERYGTPSDAAGSTGGGGRGDGGGGGGGGKK